MGFAGGKQRRFIRLGWRIDEPYEFGFVSYPTFEGAARVAQAHFDAEVEELTTLATVKETP